MARKFYTNVDLTNNRLVNLASPSSSTDAANKQYVDNLVNGQIWKAAVRAATTTNGTLATAYANGQTIDGISLVTNDRILLKNQSSGAENGIYVVAASGAPTRSSDGVTGELVASSTVRVNEGTVNADSAWTLTNDGTVTVGTTSQVWVRSDAGTPYTAGNGLTLSSASFAVNPGLGIIADGSSTRIDTAVVARKFAVAIGDGASTTLTVTHSFGTRDVLVCVYDVSTWEEVETDLIHATTNTVTVGFATAPASNAYRCVVNG